MQPKFDESESVDDPKNSSLMLTNSVYLFQKLIDSLWRIAWIAGSINVQWEPWFLTISKMKMRRHGAQRNVIVSVIVQLLMLALWQKSRTYSPHACMHDTCRAIN